MIHCEEKFLLHPQVSRSETSAAPVSESSSVFAPFCKNNLKNNSLSSILDEIKIPIRELSFEYKMHFLSSQEP